MVVKVLTLAMSMIVVLSVTALSEVGLFWNIVFLQTQNTSAVDLLWKRKKSVEYQLF